MLAYNNSVFLLFVVDWFAFVSGSTGRILKEVDSLFGHFCWCFFSFLLASLFNFARTALWICFKWNMALYVSLGGRIHKNTAFHAYLGRMQYSKPLVILIKSTLFNGVMYFSFANVFFPSKFPHIRQRLSRFVQCGSRKDMQLLF